MTMMKRLGADLARRAAIRDTAAQLRAMPLDVALDLDIDRADASGIARRAVHGA